jgi:hypothetical protein
MHFKFHGKILVHFLVSFSSMDVQYNTCIYIHYIHVIVYFKDLILKNPQLNKSSQRIAEKREMYIIYTCTIYKDLLNYSVILYVYFFFICDLLSGLRYWRSTCVLLCKSCNSSVNLYDGDWHVKQNLIALGVRFSAVSICANPCYQFVHICFCVNIYSREECFVQGSVKLTVYVNYFS